MDPISVIRKQSRQLAAVASAGIDVDVDQFDSDTLAVAEANVVVIIHQAGSKIHLNASLDRGGSTWHPDRVADPVARYQEMGTSVAFRGDAAFAQPNMYEYLESEGIEYAIRLPANQILQAEIGHLLKRPVGRPAHYVQRFYKSFRYQAASWSHPRRVVAKVEWHPEELFPRVGFVVTNLRRKSPNVVAFYNKRGMAEQYIKEWKVALKGTRLSCRSFNANAVRLQLHALAYNLGNFLRTLAIPEAVAEWSLTTLREKLIKIGAKVVSHGRHVAFQMAEVAISRQLFAAIMQRIEAGSVPWTLAA